MEQVTPGMGHNRPPAYDPQTYADIRARVDAFMKASNEIKASGPIKTDEEAERLADHIAGLRGIKKQTEATKKAEKSPHDAAGKEVLAAYDPEEERLERAIKGMLAIMSEYMDRKRAEAEAEKARKLAEAEAARKAAEEAAKAAAESGSIDAEIEAERLAKEAAKAAKSASRDAKVGVASASGGGRTISERTTREAEIKNISALFVRYRTHPKLIDCLQSLANADVRAKEITEENAAIYGVEIVVKRSAA